MFWEGGQAAVSSDVIFAYLPPMMLHSQRLHREALVQATSLLGLRWEGMKWAPDWTPVQNHLSP